MREHALERLSCRQSAHGGPSWSVPARLACVCAAVALVAACADAPEERGTADADVTPTPQTPEADPGLPDDETPDDGREADAEQEAEAEGNGEDEDLSAGEAEQRASREAGEQVLLEVFPEEQDLPAGWAIVEGPEPAVDDFGGVRHDFSPPWDDAFGWLGVEETDRECEIARERLTGLREGEAGMSVVLVHEAMEFSGAGLSVYVADAFPDLLWAYQEMITDCRELVTEDGQELVKDTWEREDAVGFWLDVALYDALTDEEIAGSSSGYVWVGDGVAFHLQARDLTERDAAEALVEHLISWFEAAHPS